MRKFNGIIAAMALGLSVAGATAQSTRPAEAEDKSAVVAEGIVNAPPEEMWRVFSTPEGYTKLGVAKAKMDFRNGGVIWSSYDPKAELGGADSIGQEILSMEPGRMLSVHIVHAPTGFPFMEAYKHVWTIVTLTDVGGGRTGVRVAMCGYGPDEESQKMREFFRTGNAWVIQKLQASYGAAAPKGPVHADGKLADISVTQLVHAPRKDVYAAFTTADGWKNCLGNVARIGMKPGEPMEIEMGSEAPAGQRGSEGCKILSLIPNEMFSYDWNAPASLPVARAHPTWVVVTFRELSPVLTEVSLRQLGFAEVAATCPGDERQFEEARAHFAMGWPMVLGAFAKHFETDGK